MYRFQVSDQDAGKHMEKDRGPEALDAGLKQYNAIIKENDDIYRDIARKFGLSECAFWILYYLRAEMGKPVQSEICSSLYRPKQSVNSALKKLGTDGYITLSIGGSGGNRRSKRILLTSSGVKLCEETVDHIIEAERSALGALTKEEQEEFMMLFDRYTKQLKVNIQTVFEKGGGRT